MAVWIDDASGPLEAESRGLLEASARALEDAGARVDADARPGFTLEKAAATFGALLSAALSGGTPRDRIEAFARVESDDAVARAQRALAIRHREWLSQNERRLQLRRAFEEFFEDWDVALLPVMPCPAIEHDHSEPQSARTARVGGEERPYLDLGVWMAPAGVCYLPATVVPVGLTRAGLPVGVQIVGPFLHDRTTLHVAALIADALGGCPGPPGF